MRSYIVVVDIIRATGTRAYRVQANSPEEAIQAAEKGDCQFVEETIEGEELDFESATAGLE